MRLAVLVLLLATACQMPGSTGGGGASQGRTHTETFESGAALGDPPRLPAGWTRPLDVAPAAEQGHFKVISQIPEPGARVRAFFLGTQF